MSQTPTPQQIIAAVREGRMTAEEAERTLTALGFSATDARSAVSQAAPSRVATAAPNFAFPLPPSTAPGEPPPSGPPVIIDPRPTPPTTPPTGPGGLPPIPTLPGLPPPPGGGGVVISQPGGGGGGGGGVIGTLEQDAPIQIPIDELALAQEQASASLGGRRGLFDQFLATQNLSPFQQRLFGGNQGAFSGPVFNPISALFSGNQLLNPQPGAPANFMNFLQNTLGSGAVTPQGTPFGLPSRQTFLDQFSQIGQAFANPSFGQTRGFEELGTSSIQNMITQAFLSGLPAGWARGGANQIGSVINSFLANNTPDQLLGAFLGGQLGGNFAGQGIFQNFLPQGA